MSPLLTKIAAAFDILTICALTCCGYDKKVPQNYLLLLGFTLCNGWMASAACLHTDPMVVMEAAILTLGVVLGITLYACTTSRDFTYCGAFLWIASMIFGLTCLLLQCFGIHHSLFKAVCGVVLFSAYLVWDTQMIMGGD